MARFTERIEAITVNVTSPDSTVRGTYTVREGLAIEISPTAVRGHTESSLSEQITAVLQGANNGFARASDSVVDDGESKGMSDPAGERRRRRYREALRDIDVRTTSPRGHVQVRMDCVKGTRLRVRQGSLGRMDLSVDGLAAEVNAAVKQAAEEFGVQRTRAHRYIVERRGL